MKRERIFLVNRHGIAIAMDVRTLGEAERLDRMKAKGVLPDGYCPMIPAAPARGPVKSYTPMKLYPKGDQEWELKPSGHMGADGVPLKSIQRADVFDLMLLKARKARKGDRSDFVPPFSPAQIMMGRHYRNLVERHASAGVQCSSVETVGGGGSGGSSSFIDAVLRDRDQIALIRERIGDGLALEVKRQRKGPKRTGTIMSDLNAAPAKAERVSISLRGLVDMVCLSDKPLAEVLRRHGWSKRGGSVSVLRAALGAALDRMMGPILRQRSYTAHADGLSLGFEQFSSDAHKGA